MFFGQSERILSSRLFRLYVYWKLGYHKFWSLWKRRSWEKFFPMLGSEDMDGALSLQNLAR
jgi:hypothetical protein